MTLDQKYQFFSGTVGTTPIAEGKINGEQVSFNLGANRVTAVAKGDVLEGTVTASGKTTPWRATRAK
jgi:hypothetical protein